MRAISLFTGAGGLDLGCEAAGFQTHAAVECDQTAVATLLANRERWFPQLDRAAVFADVVRLDADELLERAGARAGDVELLHGGPPCTPFSKSGYWLEYKRAGADAKASFARRRLRRAAVATATPLRRRPPWSARRRAR